MISVIRSGLLTMPGSVGVGLIVMTGSVGVISLGKIEQPGPMVRTDTSKTSRTSDMNRIRFPDFLLVKFIFLPNTLRFTMIFIYSTAKKGK
jgi:hypothetical protein